ASSLIEDISMRGTKMKDQPPKENDHLTYQEIARYSARELSAEQAQHVQQHCVECADCRAQLSLVMQALEPDKELDQQPEFARLLIWPAWFLWQRNQPVERAMVSLRSVWTVSRPLESRVTGDFPPLPYERVRGANSQTPSVPTNQDQLLAAEAELKRAVADH